jgi:hypothetical protein
MLMQVVHMITTRLEIVISLKTKRTVDSQCKETYPLLEFTASKKDRVFTADAHSSRWSDFRLISSLRTPVNHSPHLLSIFGVVLWDLYSVEWQDDWRVTSLEWFERKRSWDILGIIPKFCLERLRKSMKNATVATILTERFSIAVPKCQCNKWGNWVVGWRKLHNEELHNVYSSPSIIRVMKLRCMRLAGHVARMGEQAECIYIVAKPEGKRRLEKPSHR